MFEIFVIVKKIKLVCIIKTVKKKSKFMQYIILIKNILQLQFMYAVCF